MTTRDPAIVRAERLRAITTMPEYEVTIGAWIEEEHAAALSDMTSAVELHQFHRAQGAYNAMTNLKERFSQVYVAEKTVVEKIQRTVKRTIE